jgi:glycosyltransferase involved in cell wall biosynthesis
MNKLYVIKVADPHFWQSCNLIQTSMVQSLESSNFDINYIDLTEIESIPNGSHLLFLADNFLWERYFPLLINKQMHFILPIYGNMTVELNRWDFIDENLRGEYISLLCASSRSLEQISQFVSSSICKLVPYPMKATKVLPTFGSKLLYAGRITPQKNILQLMNVFIKASKFNSKLELHIAGDFHDRGFHLHGLGLNLDSFKDNFFELINNSNKKIIFHNYLTQDKLSDLIDQCQYSVSMSTYHDEDFGVSIAQGFMKGHELLLSDWGGHELYLTEINRIPVNINESLIPTINQSILFKKIVRLTERENRIVNDKILENLSFSSFNTSLEKIVKSYNKYNGQSNLYRTFSTKYRINFPFKKKEDIALYSDIYSSYTGFEIK